MSFNIGDMVQFIGFRRPLRLQPIKKLHHYQTATKFWGLAIILKTIPPKELWVSGYTNDDCGYEIYFFENNIQDKFYQEELRRYDE